MRKIVSLILVLITLLSLCAIPVSAEETITDLKKVHSNLSTYLYKPYFEKSTYFKEYQRVMDETTKVLESDDITQAEISKYYKEIREIYAKLMQDTYDYSSLYTLIETYESLDSTIFTEETWKKLLSIHDSAKKELDSPTLFSRTESTTEKQYTAYVNSHIKSFTSDFDSAFSRLIFESRPSEMTAEYLSGFLTLIRFCAREELLSSANGWNTLVTAMNEADKSLNALKKDTQTDEDEEANPDEETTTEETDTVEEIDLNKTFDNLLNAYYDVCNNAYKFSEAKEALSTFHILSEKSFSKDSWQRYSSAATALENRLKQPHFFFIPRNADKKTCEAYLKQYNSSLVSSVQTAKGALVSLEDFNKLKNLCDKYQNKTAMDGVEIKLTFLKTRVAEGLDVLSNEEATPKDVTTAIENIESAYNDLIVAEGHLLEEQGKVIKQDSRTTRYTIIFYAASLVLALGLAILLSNIFYGKVDWSK